MKTKYILISVLAVAALALGACTHEQGMETTPLESPGNVQYESDFGSITLTWTHVENAAQYYYKVENPLQYTVAKGTTENNYVTIGSLQPATTYKVFIKAIPKGDDVNTTSASAFYELEATTAAPKQYDFAWSHPATIYWDWENQVHKSNKATFGYDKTLNEYVIAAWGGVIGMDVVFSLSDQGEWLIDYEESTAYGGGPDANMAVCLYHGIGGTAKANCWFYTNNTGSSFTGNETGGHAEAWMYNPDGDWTGYYLDYGEYTPEPEPEPEPFVPELNADASWSMDAIAYFEGEELGAAGISFDVQTGVYTVTSWYGVEGHDIAFTRNDQIKGDEAGIWDIIPDASSAYIEGPDANGYYLLSHGKYGKGLASTLQLKHLGSGYEGNPKNGKLWATVVDPSGKEGQYTLVWKTDMTPFRWSCNIYVTENFIGTGVISYDAETEEYTIQSWHGVEGYDIVFKKGDGCWLLDVDKSSAYLSGPDGNGAIGLAHGIEGAALGNCWYYPSGSGGYVEGDSTAGRAGCWMWNFDGQWSEYRVEWTAGNWSAEGVVAANGVEMGTATISFDIESQLYTLHGWYGVPGYDVIFSVRETGDWNIDYVNSSACNTPDGPDGNNAVGLMHGVEGAGSSTCWFYVTDYYSYFEGGSGGGKAGCWIWTHVPEWGEYTFTW